MGHRAAVISILGMALSGQALRAGAEEAVMPPSGVKKLLEVVADGVQVYSCQAKGQAYTCDAPSDSATQRSLIRSCSWMTFGMISPKTTSPDFPGILIAALKQSRTSSRARWSTATAWGIGAQYHPETSSG